MCAFGTESAVFSAFCKYFCKTDNSEQSTNSFTILPLVNETSACFLFYKTAHALSIYFSKKINSNNHFSIKNLLRKAGLKYAIIKYNQQTMDRVDNYLPEINCSLPFNWKWYVANSGITQNTSHSWDILPQFLVYDFIMVDEHGKVITKIREIWIAILVMEWIFLPRWTGKSLQLNFLIINIGREKFIPHPIARRKTVYINLCCSLLLP